MSDASDIALKYQRLAQEYAKLKAQNQVLKKAVLDVKEDSAKLQISLQEKEQAIRRSQQEIDSSNFRSQQMVKRIELLQLELEQKEKKGKVAIDKNHANVSSVLDEDLRQKILENELLHKQVHEYNTEKRQMEQRFNDELSAAKLHAKTSSEALENLRETHFHESEQLKNETMILHNQLESLKSESQQSAMEMAKNLGVLEKENEKLELKVAHLGSTVKEVVVFNDHEFSDYNQLKLLSHNKRYEIHAQELFKTAQTLIRDFCKFLKDFHVYTKQRGNLYPVDSTLQTLPEASVKLSQYSDEASVILDSLASAFSDAYHISATSQHEGILRLGSFSSCFEQYIAVFSKFLPYQLSCLEKETELSVCVPALQSKNHDFVSSFEKFLPAVSKLSTYLKYIIGPKMDKDENQVEKVLFSSQKIVSSFNELHLLFKDLSKAFNSKIALEQQLPTTTKAPELQTANEFLLGSLLSLSSIVVKLSGLVQTDIEFISEAVATSRNSIMSKICLSKKSGEFMEKINISSPPQSVPYQEAIDRKQDIQSENREELLQQLQEVTKKLQNLEREKEHWLLETQLLQMKLEKVKTVEIKPEVGETGRTRNESLSLKPLETAMFGDVASSEENQDLGNKSTEELIKQHLTARLSEAALKAQVAEGKALHFENECRMLHKHLAILRNKKQSLHDEVDASSQRVSQLQDELSVTQRSYEEKLSLMSEHLTVMNDKIATQKDEIESLKTKTPTPKKSKPFRLHGL